MGTPSDPTEPDYENGNECTECVDTIFNGHTPKYVKVNIEGVEVCPPIEDLPDGFGNAILKQDDGEACRWKVFFQKDGNFQNYNWHIDFGAPNESVLTYDVGGVPVFEGLSGSTCTANFSNNLTCIGGDATEGGTVGITWGPEINQEAYDAQF